MCAICTRFTRSSSRNWIPKTRMRQSAERTGCGKMEAIQLEKQEQKEEPKMMRSLLNPEILQRLKDEKFDGNLTIRWRKGIVSKFNFSTSYYRGDDFRTFRREGDFLEEDE